RQRRAAGAAVVDDGDAVALAERLELTVPRGQVVAPATEQEDVIALAGLAVVEVDAVDALGGHRAILPAAQPLRQSARTSNGLPFSTTYVASPAAFPIPTFRTECTVSAGTIRASPALTVTGSSPSSLYSREPSRT